MWQSHNKNGSIFLFLVLDFKNVLILHIHSTDVWTFHSQYVIELLLKSVRNFNKWPAFVCKIISNVSIFASMAELLLWYDTITSYLMNVKDPTPFCQTMEQNRSTADLKTTASEGASPDRSKHWEHRAQVLPSQQPFPLWCKTEARRSDREGNHLLLELVNK